MGLFGKNKKKKQENAASEEICGEVSTKETKPDPAAERARQKKIKNMKSKFDETVFSTALERMKNDIPKFVLFEPDPDIEGAQITRYVVLGFDTKIVDDFSNKSDDDIGSILTAIKHSMDCVIEYGLFDNELILMIPTAKTLSALAEFEETFDLKFYIAYVTEDHAISLETKSPDSDNDYIVITLPEIREMLNKNIPIGDKIKELQSDGFKNSDSDDITSDISDEKEEEIPNEEDIPNEEEVPDEKEEEIPDEEEVPNEEEIPAKTTASKREDLEKATSNAVKENERIANQVNESKEDIGDNTQVGQAAPAQAAPAQTAPAQAAPAGDAKNQITDKMGKLKNAVQSASDQALKDTNIKSATANINPQARMQSFNQDAMDQYITRKYYSDDLGLEISSEPFDAMFLQDNPYIPFVEEDSDSWLTENLNNLRRDANARLAKLHQENLMLMRERYMLIITKHCENIVKSVSTDDPDSRFGFVLKTISKTKNDKIAAISDEAEKYKREKEQHYQARLKIEMDNAANAAKAAFENRYRADHERELKEIETDLKNNIENEYVADIDNLKAARRTEAKRQLDVGISEALSICADEYTKMLAMERKEYVRLQDVIANFMNENMALEQSRVLTLAEEQRRENEVVKVRKEYDSKYELANRDFEAKLLAVKAEMDKANTEHDNYVIELREQHEKMMQDLRNAHKDQLQLKDNEIKTIAGQLENANAQIDTLTKKYIELDEKTGRKYSTQIDMLRSERDAWTERSEQVERMHKYTDKIKITVMIISIIAALGIGIIAGCAFTAYTANQNNENKAPVIHYIDENGNEKPINSTESTTTSEKNSNPKNDSESDSESTTKPANTVSTTKPASTTASTNTTSTTAPATNT